MEENTPNEIFRINLSPEDEERLTDAMNKALQNGELGNPVVFKNGIEIASGWFHEHGPLPTSIPQLDVPRSQYDEVRFEVEYLKQRNQSLEAEIESLKAERDQLEDIIAQDKVLQEADEAVAVAAKRLAIRALGSYLKQCAYDDPERVADKLIRKIVDNLFFADTIQDKIEKVMTRMGAQEFTVHYMGTPPEPSNDQPDSGDDA